MLASRSVSPGFRCCDNGSGPRIAALNRQAGPNPEFGWARPDSRLPPDRRRVAARRSYFSLRMALMKVWPSGVPTPDMLS